MKSSVVHVKFAMMGIAAVLSLAGCVVRRDYPSDITTVRPYPRQTRSSSVLTVQPVPVEIPPSAVPPKKTHVRLSDSRPATPPAPKLDSMPIAPPAYKQDPISVSNPVKGASPCVGMAAQIRTIYDLRKSGVLTQDESDRLVLRVVEQAK